MVDSLIEYLKYREGDWVGYAEIERFGFLNITEDGEAGSSMEEQPNYQVSRVVYCSRTNSYQATEKQRGIIKCFWPILFYTLDIEVIISENGENE